MYGVSDKIKSNTDTPVESFLKVRDENEESVVQKK